jgi:2-polyprenyl-3-methyl-5-hydroxy-6-metoxy-1,4-benzoquinol methylase
MPIYQNAGNEVALSLIPIGARRILDVGCGAGDNARQLKIRAPKIDIVGVTLSKAEAEMARAHCSSVHLFDLNRVDIRDVGEPFDAILLSHVLEHLLDPVGVLRKLLPLLRPGGHVIIAVPNVLEWRTRAAFMLGKFDYADHGILDRTHAKFYTYLTAERELLRPLEDLQVKQILARGAAPLGPLRRHLLPSALRQRIDHFAVRRWPNLFASEIAMLAQKNEMALAPP